MSHRESLITYFRKWRDEYRRRLKRPVTRDEYRSYSGFVSHYDNLLKELGAK